MEKFDGDNSLVDLISRVQDTYNKKDDSLFKFKTKLEDKYEASVVVDQDGKDLYVHNEQNDDTSTPEDAYQHFPTQQRDILINDIIKGTVCE